MKGKKFDAHEKHFKELELKLKKEIKHLRDGFSETNSVNTQLVKENEQLLKENNNIKDKYNKLLEYSKLSNEDIKTALSRDKALVNLSGLIGVANRYL